MDIAILQIIANLCSSRLFVKDCQKCLSKCVLIYEATGATNRENSLLFCVSGSYPDSMSDKGDCERL